MPELVSSLCGCLGVLLCRGELVPQFIGARLGAIGSFFRPIGALSGLVCPILRPIRPGFSRLGAKAA